MLVALNPHQDKPVSQGKAISPSMIMKPRGLTNATDHTTGCFSSDSLVEPGRRPFQMTSATRVSAPSVARSFCS